LPGTRSDLDAIRPLRQTPVRSAAFSAAHSARGPRHRRKTRPGERQQQLHPLSTPCRGDSLRLRLVWTMIATFWSGAMRICDPYPARDPVWSTGGRR